ncbi:MAG: hypothetical protein ACI3V0_02945 [Faecousia sp.]
MYQGKFDKKGKNPSMDIHEITASRNAAVAAQKKAAAEAAAPQSAARKRSAAPEQEYPAARKSVSRDVTPRSQSVSPQAAPKKAAREAAVQAAPKRRGPRLGGVIFYTIYFLFIFLFFVAVYFGLQWGYGWLCDYEAAQPTAKAEEVFHQLFDDPDWGALYASAGIADTAYEGRDSFVTYMDNLVGDKTLTYQETSAGLSGGKKYFVKLDDKRLASFTMITDGDPNSLTEVSNWYLDKVELFYDRSNGYKIQTVDGHVPLINGVALTDDHIIQMSTSKNDTSGFLPEGITTAKSSIYQITNLIAEPTIAVVDKNGNQMDVVYDDVTKMYVEQAQEVTISEAEKEIALKALKTYAKYQVKEASAAEVATYFDPTGDAYKSIMQTVLTWTKGNNGISFDNDTVTSYCRYSDTMFSAYVTTDLTIKLTDGGSQTKPINSTLLFSKASGNWKVTKMSNANLSETVGKVRLTFMNGDTKLSSDFYDMNSETLATPLLSVPAGKVFSGWYTETVKDNGTIEQSLVFVPDENGDVTIPSGTTLTPMVLYPLFEDASAVQAAAPETAATEGA